MRTTSNGYAPRLAERVARRIELDIIARGLVAGDSLGNEAELMDRYGVSRGVIREAVTLVEHHMQAETRRGNGGGLVVAEPDVRVITEMASLYLARKMVSVEHVFSTRVYLETQAAEGIIASMHPDKAAALREEAIRPDPGEDIGVGAERFHALLAALSSNPVIEMLLPILSGLISDVSSAAIARMSARVRKQVWREVTHEHSLIAEAIIAGDLPAVRRHLTAHLITSHKALPPGNPVVIIRELTGG